VTQTPREIIQGFLDADKVMSDRFNSDFSWRPPGIEDRLDLVDARLCNTITALCLVAKALDSTADMTGGAT
jgi:hypothetical protein